MLWLPPASSAATSPAVSATGLLEVLDSSATALSMLTRSAADLRIPRWRGKLRLA